MKIILDGVFSHVGSRSAYFQQAIHDPASPYRGWFRFKQYPNVYDSWWGITTLPCIDKLNPDYMDYIIDSDDSVVVRWLKLGADGWRLDVSAGEIPLASRRLSDSSLLLLLDGQTASASPVLARLTVTRPPGASGCVRVLPNPDDPSIYYWKETENMPAATSDAMPAAIPAAARLAACGFLLPEAGGSATAAPPETAASPEISASADSSTPPEPPTGDAEYIGCQEATGASGDLCVRFLFRVPAGGAACAAVWIAGYAPAGSAPGAGRLAISRMSSVRTGARGVYEAGAGSFLLAYTYTGLPSSGELVFALRDGSGVLRSAVYRDGAFAGYCD